MVKMDVLLAIYLNVNCVYRAPNDQTAYLDCLELKLGSIHCPSPSVYDVCFL